MQGSRKKGFFKRFLPDDVEGEYIAVVVAVGALLLAQVVFLTLPETLDIQSYRVPVLSALAGLLLGAIGHLIIRRVQRDSGQVAAEALDGPIKALNDEIVKIKEIRMSDSKKTDQMRVFFDDGVIGVFANRAAAMPRFVEEMQREDQSIYFVGTSLRGTLDPEEENEDRLRFYQTLLDKRLKGVKIRALLMHPDFGKYREAVEGRNPGAVTSDIKGTLKYLLLPGADQVTAASLGTNAESSTDQMMHHLLRIEDVRLYRGVVTAYAIFTRKAALVNLSTLYGPVYDNLTLILQDTDAPSSLYKRLREHHFLRPWTSENTVRLSGPEGAKILSDLAANSTSESDATSDVHSLPAVGNPSSESSSD